MVLTQLSPGQSARIKNMNQLTRPLRRKLMVMGLLPQTEVLYLRAAPLGDPLQIQCQGERVARDGEGRDARGLVVRGGADLLDPPRGAEEEQQRERVDP